MLPVRPPLLSLPKAFGGKRYLRDWIIPELPAGRIFCEPYAYAANVLLNCPPSPVEFLGDKNPEIPLLWTVVRDQPGPLHDRLAAIPLERAAFEDAWGAAMEGRWGRHGDAVDAAASFLIRNRMSREGKQKAFCWQDRLRRKIPGELSAWVGMLRRIGRCSARLANVVIRGATAEELIRFLDAEDTVFYLDPPYLHQTRTGSKKEYGDFEMSEDDHRALLDLVRSLKGAVVLSGNPSPLYDAAFEPGQGWRRVERPVKNHAAQARTKNTRIEVLWINHRRLAP